MPHLLHRVDRLVAGRALGHLTPLTDAGHLSEVISVRYNPLTDNECWGLRLVASLVFSTGQDPVKLSHPSQGSLNSVLYFILSRL